jgi:tetratricopeptide (TPR) repeat protein
MLGIFGHRAAIALLAAVAVLLAAGIAWRQRAHTPPPAPAPLTAVYVDERACRSCHAREYAAWAGSHHALAMQRPTATSVLGDFADASARGASTGPARFRQRDGRYWIRTAGPDGRSADFAVRFTFGVDPLQQYLLPLPGGRLQAFTLAWDTQQHRWFDLNPGAAIHPDNALHWTGPAYNWNYMCAACHSSGVHKNYDFATASFATTFEAVNVTCQACHGPASTHLARQRRAPPPARALPGEFADDPMQRSADAQIDTCAPCHARRSALGATAATGAPLLDGYVPALLEDPLYYADGQIRDEVYEYASFLQSRMYARGVRCSDCHEPHTLKTRAPADAICTSCHNAATPTLRHAIDLGGLQHRDYTAPAHHFHVTGRPGSHCVDCHMPTRIYMRIHVRHDHSLRIPRPDLSVRLGTPNACNNCHRDRSAAWAAAAVARWYGAGRRQEHVYGEQLWAGRRHEPGAVRGLQALVQDAAAPSIVRATALKQLHAYPSASNLRLFAATLADPSALVRLQAVAGLEQLAPSERVAELAPRLSDPIRAVREEAARLLAATPASRLTPPNRLALRGALAEYVASQQANADRPEAHLNLGNLYASQGDATRAAEEYAAALRLDPGFVPAYVNQADLDAAGGALDAAAATLGRGLQQAPDSAPLHHALGLTWIRQGRGAQALAELQRAVQLAPDEARFAYVYGVALHDLRGTAPGLAALRAALARFPNDRDLLLAIAAYAQSAGDTATAQRCLQRLRSIEAPAGFGSGPAGKP